ncbi:hypothetical protein P170DRAFT_399651 [Aspergillus steynii IBT 23096]|uniref:Zn(2)-C6 fungal-type domain-containing protein n=1 Tax=Aspergillus steynii IBT 23096 TaxID=1392250 RepID=A0A2I2GRL5_9EURO|nr:uncharacterized protein P170DRAFT_399651 [Aspergillus steynii IBT 23096]PLB55494.1 hypothetical protein P170DRAFT_399651 [Aspergillus steynii IBT 23096]
MGPNLSDHNRSVAQSPRSYRRKRKTINCDQCRRSKLRCDRQHPCGSCKRRNREFICFYETNLNSESPSHRSAQARGSRGARLTSPSGLSLPLEPPTSEANQAPPDSSHWETVLERPVPEQDADDTLSPLSMGPHMTLQEILDALPPRNCCDYLVSHFFTNISALFPILHGPTFQKQYTSFMQQPHGVDLSWLALLFSMCSLVLNTMDASDPRLATLWSQLSFDPTPNTTTLSASRRLLQTAMSCLLQDQFLIRHKFSTFEALLMIIYSTSHNGSVDQGWALLGMALNMGIALRCNTDDQSLGPIETERRRRCWAGLLTLHTYQCILFRDVDMSFLLDIKATMPVDANDSDITEDGISHPSRRTQPTQMSVMMSKLRLFRLSTQICRHISGPSRLDQRLLHHFDDAIAQEQNRWDATYMVDGSPSILDSTSYAYWCVLQTYAHHLYLLLHRPFHHSKAPCFLASSRTQCIAAAMALISLHREIFEVPLLRNYRWLLNGVTSLKALHAAVALNSCLLDTPSSDRAGDVDVGVCREEIEKLVLRMENFSPRSMICLKAHRILCSLQAQWGGGNPPPSNSETQPENILKDWTDIRGWMDADFINWNLDGAFSGS